MPEKQPRKYVRFCPASAPIIRILADGIITMLSKVDVVSRRQKMALWCGIAVLGAALISLLTLRERAKPVTLTGVVIRQDSDPRKQEPIPGVEIAAAGGLALQGGQSDSSGFFHLTLPSGIKPHQPITLLFRHPDYKPLTQIERAGDMLYVVRMSPIPRAASVVPGSPTEFISHVSIRYTVRTSTTMDVGSAVKTFKVENIGNLECNNRKPCSPNGKWKATDGTMTVDAGEGNQLHNPRVSCIAGPCPFTKIESVGLAEDGRIFKVKVRDWSDPATFLIEAEVVHAMYAENVRQSYPAILGRALDFSAPGDAEGVSLEAEVNGIPIIFPLGPNLCLSWAECTAKAEKDHSSAYHCELKPTFDFVK